MPRISYSVTKETKENIETICEGLGITIKDFMDEALFHFLTYHEHKIDHGMSVKNLERKERRRQKQLYFIKNELKRLYLQVEWQYRIFAEVDFESVKQTIENAKERYELLDEDIKLLLTKQFSKFLEYSDRKQFDFNFDNLVPKVREKNVKQIR